VLAGIRSAAVVKGTRAAWLRLDDLVEGLDGPIEFTACDEQLTPVVESGSERVARVGFVVVEQCLIGMTRRAVAARARGPGFD
jgi:hypothetical protein